MRGVTAELNRRSREWTARRLPWLLVALAAGYVLVFRSNPLGAEMYAADSLEYVGFDSSRSAGYPIFLALTTALFGTVDAAPALQLLLAATAFAFLAWSVHRAFDAPRLALLVALALFGNWELATYHAMLLTESCFIAALAVMMGAMARLVARPTAGWAGASALACGLAIAVRPAGMSLLPIWPILLWFVWNRCAGRRLGLVAAIVAPLAACSLAEGTIWKARHGNRERPSVVNLHLFAKGLMIDGVQAAPDDEPARFLIRARREMAPAREFVAGAPGWQVRMLFLRRYEMWAHRDLFSEETSALADRRGVTDNRLRGEVGRLAIAAAPAAWLKNAFNHYLGLWWVSQLPSPAVYGRYVAYVAQPGGVPIIGEIEDIRPYPRAALATRLVMVSAFLASFPAVALAVRQRLRRGPGGPDPALVLAALSALLVHGHFLLVGLTGTVVTRYAVAMWPVLVLCGLLTVGHALGRPERRGARPLAR